MGQKMDKLFISFSGGETSAYMMQWALKNLAHKYKDIVCIFANTGQENEETLSFVNRCQMFFGFDVVWVEAKVHSGRKGSTHRVVDFLSASRNGKPFEEMIKKYGIPNQAYPHCTRELKLNPMTSYLRSIGWQAGSYDTAIGIRSDEIDRVSPKRKELKLIYPLVSPHPMTKPRINAWWDKQPFRLNLKGYEGNCKWCWKKSLRKHLTLITEHPEWYDFPEEMEKIHGLSGHNLDGKSRTFFRNHLSVKDLRQIAKKGGWIPADDDSKEYQDQLEMDLDSSNGCSESCEIDWES